MKRAILPTILLTLILSGTALAQNPRFNGNYAADGITPWIHILKPMNSSLQKPGTVKGSVMLLDVQPDTEYGFHVIATGYDRTIYFATGDASVSNDERIEEGDVKFLNINHGDTVNDGTLIINFRLHNVPPNLRGFLRVVIEGPDGFFVRTIGLYTGANDRE